VLIASALAPKYSDPAQFNSSRDLSVHIGLTPRLIAGGNKQQMLGITKRGDRYLRKQLIHEARALMIFAPKRRKRHSLPMGASSEAASWVQRGGRCSG